jgi:hypothetical protein
MKLFPYRTALLLAAAAALAGGPPPSTVPAKLRVLVLDGPPHQRGLVHGRAMKEQIHQIVRFWKAELAAAFKTDADEFIRRIAHRTGFVAAVRQWTPDLLDEVRGLAEGAGVEFDTMFALQLPDECFAHGAAIAGERCSSLGFGPAGGRPACVAQNLDAPSFTDGFQLVLHVKGQGGDPDAFVLTQAGCIGLNGVNSRAVGVCCNALWQLAGNRDGLPVAFVVRGVLRQRSVEDAVAFLQRVRHASGQNYVVGGPARVFSYECSANRVARFAPAGRDDVVWHTNHPLASDDYGAPYRALRADPAALAAGEANTRTRLRCLEDRLTGGRPARDVDGIKATLAARDSAEYPVCRARGGAAFTFASTVMVLSEPPVFHVAPGPPDVTPYEALSFPRPPG